MGENSHINELQATTIERCLLKNTALYIKLTGLTYSTPFLWLTKLPDTTVGIQFNRNAKVQSFKTSNLTKTFSSYLTSRPSILWLIVTIISWIYYIFIATDIYYQIPIYLETKNFVGFHLHVFWISGYSVVATYRLHFVLKRKQIVFGMNQLLKFVHHLQCKYPDLAEQFLKPNIIIEKYIFLAFATAVVGPTAYGLMAFPFPNHRPFLIAWLPVRWRFEIPGFSCLGALYEIFFSSFQWSGFLAECIFNILFIENMSNIVQVFERNADKFHRLDLLQSYQKLRLLNTIYHSGFGNIGLPGFKLTVSVIILVSTTAGIKFLDQVNIILILFSFIVSIVTCAVLIILMMRSAKLCTISEQLIRDLNVLTLSRDNNGNGNNVVGGITTKSDSNFMIVSSSFSSSSSNEIHLKEIKATIKACPFIAIQMSCVYYIKRITPITYFSIMLTYLVTILIGLNA